MKVAVINFSGNVGKSTVARHLLAPRMNNANIIAIETINNDDAQAEATLKGKDFGQLQDALAILDDAIVDVGASNVEDFVKLMKQYRGSHEDFDYFVVPVVPAKKQQSDTISTIDALASLGVPPQKIRVVFNMLEIDAEAEQVFSGLIEYSKAEKLCTIRPAAVIHQNEIFGKLKDLDGKGIKDILSDPTDWTAKLQEAKSPEEKLQFARMRAVKRLAIGVDEELDAVFKNLFSGK